MKKTSKLLALGALTLGVAAGCASERNSVLAAGFDSTDGAMLTLPYPLPMFYLLLLRVKPSSTMRWVDAGLLR